MFRNRVRGGIRRKIPGYDAGKKDLANVGERCTDREEHNTVTQEKDTLRVHLPFWSNALSIV